MKNNHGPNSTKYWLTAHCVRMTVVVVRHIAVLYLSVILRDALVAMGDGEGNTCKQLQRVLFEDGQVVDDCEDLHGWSDIQ